MVILIQPESLCLQMYILNLCTISLSLTYSSAAQHQSFFFSFFTIIIVSVCVYSQLSIFPPIHYISIYFMSCHIYTTCPQKSGFQLTQSSILCHNFKLSSQMKKIIILLVVRVLQMQSQDDNQGAWLLAVTTEKKFVAFLHFKCNQ